MKKRPSLQMCFSYPAHCGAELKQWVFALVFCFMLPWAMIWTSSAQAENLVSVKTYNLAPLSVPESISQVVSADGQIIALGENTAWALSEIDGQWVQFPVGPKNHMRGVISDGSQTALLISDTQNGNITGVGRYIRASADHTVNARTPFPPFPEPLISAQGTFLLGKLYIVGMSSDGTPRFFVLDPSVTQPIWLTENTGPLAQGSVTSIVAQNALLLITMETQTATNDRLLQWAPEEKWLERTSVPGTVVAKAGRAIGQGHAIYLVSGPIGTADKLELVGFHTITGSWANYGELDSSYHLDRAASFHSVGWKNGIVWGMQAPGQNSTHFHFVDIETGKHLLHYVDWAVIVFYLAATLGVGYYFYQRNSQGSEADFFLGGRSIPFWAAGISLYASNASSISYIAVPAKAFATNWQYLMSNLIVVLGLMFVAVWIVPLLRRLDLMSSFHYLESRFHPSIRVLSSALFIVFQLAGRMTIILFLPSLAISTVTGIDVAFSILIMGGITIIYTVLGGMKAVIWTDVMQLFVMFGGTIFAIIFVMSMLDGGMGEFLTTAIAENKMKLLDWRFDLTEATVWGFIFLIFFDTVLTFPKDQVLMQRVLSTSSAKEAGRSVWTFAAIVIPGSVMFYLIGTALYVFYQSHPERMDPSLSLDATFPLFIAAELPIGITGLIIAGIFAASMSTLSSILNSVATLATVDFYEKIGRDAGEKTNVRFAEIVTVIGGLIGISFALLLSRFEIPSLLDLALELWGLLGGGFAGAYTLGMFTRRANWQGVVIGVVVSIAVTLAAWTVSFVHPYFYLPLSIFVCITVGYVASFLFPAPTTLKGLTIYRRDAL